MNDIATSSVEEGLDFALNLIAGATATAGEQDSDIAQAMLRQMSQIISLRNAGELRLAVEQLERVHEAVPSDVGDGNFFVMGVETGVV